jgi:hypothetical protein
MYLLLALMMSAAPETAPHDHAACPMAGTHREEVDHRHDQATGVPHEGAAHHFLLTPEGGTIRLEATRADDTATRDRIRGHVAVVARAFAAGDFALPMEIHARVPPGVDVMTAKKSAILYAFAPTDRGGEVRITTSDAEARAAVHAFLRFQIEDHVTGDPQE